MKKLNKEKQKESSKVQTAYHESAEKRTINLGMEDFPGEVAFEHARRSGTFSLGRLGVIRLSRTTLPLSALKKRCPREMDVLINLSSLCLSTGCINLLLSSPAGARSLLALSSHSAGSFSPTRREDEVQASDYHLVISRL